MFILDELHHVSYLHCQSPHDHADCSIDEFIDHLKKEEIGLTTDCALDVANRPEDCQVFEIVTSRVFHDFFYKTYDNIELFDAAVVGANAFTKALSTFIKLSSRLNLLIIKNIYIINYANFTV